MRDLERYWTDRDPFNLERIHAAEERVRKVQPPEQVLADLHLDVSSVLVNIGCGTGFFTLPAARMVTNGRVIEVDALQGNLDILKRRALAEGLENIQTICADGTGLPVKSRSADAVLVARLFRDFPHWTSLRSEVRRILRPGGRLCIMEWDDTVAVQGPILGIWVAPDELAQIVDRSGFKTTHLLRAPKPFYRILATRVA